MFLDFGFLENSINVENVGA